MLTNIMKTVIAAIVLSLAAVSANAQSFSMDDWTTVQKVSYATSITAAVIDWGQTRTIAKTPERFQERNRLLGPHPSLGEVNTYFVGLTSLLVVLPHISDTYREHMMPLVAAGLVVNVARNHFTVGIRMSW